MMALRGKCANPACSYLMYSEVDWAKTIGFCCCYRCYEHKKDPLRYRKKGDHHGPYCERVQAMKATSDDALDADERAVENKSASLSASSVTSKAGGRAPNSLRFKCANPACGFLVHSNVNRAESIGYCCCYRCFEFKQNPKCYGKKAQRHGPLCERDEAIEVSGNNGIDTDESINVSGSLSVTSVTSKEVASVIVNASSRAKDTPPWRLKQDSCIHHLASNATKRRKSALKNPSIGMSR